MSKHSVGANPRVTVPMLRAMTSRSQRIAMVTAYDATFARMLDEGGADVLLVGDSLGMVVQGQDTTLPVTLDEMIYHCRAVARGSKRAHLVGDMPFMSYQVSPKTRSRTPGAFSPKAACMRSSSKAASRWRRRSVASSPPAFR